VNVHPTKTAAAGAGLLILLGLVAHGGTARAAAPDSLAVFSAAAAATPYGVVSRVPATTSGGLLDSATSVDLGKARAVAAGFTAGDLGDLFIVSSAPPGTITDVPTVIRAQQPPQAKAPATAEFAGGRSGSPDTGEARNFTLDAAATEVPSATAGAAGHSVSSQFYSSGASTSASRSQVQPDGTVVATATTTVQDIVLGSPGAQLTIAAAESVAGVTIPIGKKPVTQLSTHILGAQLAGVPVVLDEHGLSIDKSVALPASAIAAFTAAMQSLAANGLTIIPIPRQEKVDDSGAAVSGAVFAFRYRAPDAIPRPSDIGSDQTVTVASVAAAATSRARAVLTPPASTVPGSSTPAGIAPVDTGAVGRLTAAVAATAPTAGVEPTGLRTAETAPTVAALPTARDPELLLPSRVADPLPIKLRSSYRRVLLAALGTLLGLFLLIRKRPV
jgi:hypothetical protein